VAVIRVLRPRQVRPRSAGLLAPRPLGHTLCRVCSSLAVRAYPDHHPSTEGSRVSRVTGQQVLQPGQLPRQRLVGLHQLRELPGHRGDDLPSLAPHHGDQLAARHLLRPGHRKVKPYTSRLQHDRHAHITDRRISTPTAARQPSSTHGLNIYPWPGQGCHISSYCPVPSADSSIVFSVSSSVSFRVVFDTLRACQVP
jgi:hypothetical protein